jgi:magnesium-transporting ATPase (P-type)
LKDLRSDSKQSLGLREFLTALAVCHTVVPHVDDKGVHAYRASSPDEAALVIAAKQLGYEFWERSERAIRVRVTGGGILEFELLVENQFTSDRRCMSTVVRIPSTGEIILYCKGADEAMFPKLRTELQRNEDEVRSLFFSFVAHRPWNPFWFYFSFSFSSIDDNAESFE